MTIDHKIGTREEWAGAREELLAREKEHTRLGDDIARQRRNASPPRLTLDIRDAINRLSPAEAALSGGQVLGTGCRSAGFIGGDSRPLVTARSNLGICRESTT
jgi:Bacterial protein of unknown function (DUF899)